MKQPALILGATSDIAVAIARRLAAEGHPLQLAGRDRDALDRVARDLAVRHDVPVTVHGFDVLEAADHDALLAALEPLPAIVVSAIGVLGDQSTSERDPQEARRILRSNFEGPALILEALADRLSARGDGAIVGISSVAGERGRASNYVYGSAKAGLTAYLSGLRNRLSATRVRVITVLPGFVATRMTDGMDLPPRLTAQPGEVADAVWRALNGRRDVVYVKPLWRLIMAIIRAIPEPMFRKMRI